MNGSEILLYQSEDGDTKIEVRLENDTVWLNQGQIAELFQVERSVITKHIANIYDSGELEEIPTSAKIAQVQLEGKRRVTRQIEYYDLDVIISVGYRVNSHRGIQFRKWATKTLREYMIKGFVLDDERLSGERGNYFDELNERVRRIRLSEINFYDKVKAIFATSVDYDSRAEIAVLFYKVVQNKFHYAVTNQTAAEIIVHRVNAYKPNMGMTSNKRNRVTREDAKIAKNYYEEDELKRLGLLVEQFLAYAELQSVERRVMYMSDWAKKLDDFIRFNEKPVLTHAGSVSHHAMEALVNEEYDAYQQKQLANGVISEAKPARKSRKRRPVQPELLPPESDDD
jgi:hypothetical protein